MSNAIPKNVPQRAQKAYDLRRQGLSWEEIGAMLKVAPATACNYANLCETAGQGRLAQYSRASPEMVNPEKTAEIVDLAMTERGLDREKFLELAAQAGMPAKMANGLMARVRTRWGAVYKEVKRLKGEELVDKLHDRLSVALEFLDDYALANASGKDLAIIIGILVEKAQLVGGKPTQIYDHTLGMKLQTMMPAFMEEARRRGITLDVTASAKLIEEENA